MLNKAMQKGVIVTMLVFGSLITMAAPSALAQDRNCRRGNSYNTSYYDNNRSYNDRYYRDSNYRRDRVYRDNSYRNDNYYDDYYYRDRNTTGRTLRDVGIGAAVGAGGGALLGGKKGALIGAAIGAAGGYVYNRGKNRNRY
jgi:YmgG-like glycine-zipper protein